MAGALPFAKGQALGNDYLVIEAADLPWPLDAARVRALCHRHFGAGSDGLLVVDTGADPVALRIYNPDGSEAEKSGNGLRILAAYLYRRGLVGRETFPVRLPAETVDLRVEGEGDHGELLVAVAMGQASFRGRDAGFGPEPGEVDTYDLAVSDGEYVPVRPVSVGNPHCVVIEDRLDRDRFLRFAPQLAAHPAFASGTNVQFARVPGAGRLDMLIWERGAGETMASGSSACAAAAAAVRAGLLRHGAVTVEMPGGRVEVDVAPDYAITLRGPAELVYTGRFEPDLVQRLA